MALIPAEIDNVLAEFLKSNAVIDQEQYEQVAAQSDGTDGGVISYMLAQNLISEDIISDSFSKFYGLKKVQINNDMLRKRPFQDKISNIFIKQNRLIPFRSNDNSVTVVIADPTALNNVNDVKRLTGCSVEMLVTNLSAFENYLSSLSDSNDVVPEPQDPAGDSNVEAAPVRASDRRGGGDENGSAPHEVGFQEDGEHTGSEIIDFVDFVIEKAVSHGTSDIHFEIFRNGARLRIRKDGMLQESGDSMEFLYKNYSAISTRIKILADLDISERRLPQDGGIAYKFFDKRTVDIRVSVLPTVHGERIVMRILDPSAANFGLDEIGIPEETLKVVRKAIHAPQGMVLVTGPTGSGKSTTLYSFLKELNEDSVNIMTAEDPVEFDLDGVGQVLVKDNIGLTFTAALRSFLRQDPEIIMVGEIRDKDTSDISIKAALTGHLVLSTLHTNDAPSTITRMINMGVPAYLITAALSLVVAQRLSRVVCPDCKEEDKLQTIESLVSIGFTEEEAQSVKPCKGAGCEKCNNTGIRGRRGIYEVLYVTDAIKEAIMAGETDIAIKEIAKKEGFVTMQGVGRGLISEGIISVEEFQRILMLD